MSTPNDPLVICPSPLKPFLQFESLGKRIGRSHAFDHAPVGKIFAEYHRDLVQMGASPDLRVVIRNRMFPRAAQGLYYYRWREGKNWKSGKKIIHMNGRFLKS